MKGAIVRTKKEIRTFEDHTKRPLANFLANLVVATDDAIVGGNGVMARGRSDDMWGRHWG
jgi:hypothetical protein